MELKTRAQFVIDDSMSPPSCLPVEIDRSELIDITRINDPWRRYIDQTGREHYGGDYFAKMQLG